MARTKQTSRKSTGGKKKSSPLLVIESDDLAKLTVVKLKERCSKMGIECKGKKADLIRAIIDAEGRHSVRLSPSSITIPTKTKKTSTTKKVATSKKTSVKKALPKKKVAKAVALSPPRYNYAKMTLPELKKECRKRQLKDSKRKCPNISKKDLVELLKLWDGLDLPEVVASDSSSASDSSEEESPVKTVKKAATKKAVAKKVTKKKSPVKKVVKKTTTKKVAKAVALSPPRYNYAKMTLPELKKECRKRQLKDPKTRKCPNISKTRMVALLKLWDGMDLPEVVTSDSSEEESSVKIVRKTTKKTVTKKKSPVKKTTKKKVSAKKASAKKRCDDEEDYEECDEDKVCSATSGKCVKDTKAARKGKAELHVDGRVIIGTDKVIKDLQKVLGGKISGTPSPVKKKTTPKKKVSPKKKVTPKKKTPLFTQAEKEAYKKRVSGKGVITHKASPDIFDLFKSEAESEEERLEDLLKVKPKKKTPVKKTKQKAKVEKKTPVKVLKQRDIIQKTFEECLESLGGEM
jgi:SAP domain